MEKKIEKCIRMLWSSLESHLPHCYGKRTQKQIDEGNTPEFHQLCVQEYAMLIKDIAEMYPCQSDLKSQPRKSAATSAKRKSRQRKARTSS